MKFAFIRAEKASFPVALLCRVLQVSRQGFYASQGRPEPARRVVDLALGGPQSYGLPVPDHKLFETHPIINSQMLYYVGHGKINVKPDVAELCGSRVRFVDGIFADAKGVLERIADDRRVAILLELLGREVRVFVSPASVGVA